MVDKLEACPFCGGEAKRFTIGDDDPNNVGGDVIACTRCQASSHVEFGRKENLVSCWNRRTPANGEQVERVKKGWFAVLRAGYVAAEAAGENDGPPARYGGIEALRAALAASKTTTPTEDTRERVKVLEEALNGALGRENAWRDDLVLMGLARDSYAAALEALMASSGARGTYDAAKYYAATKEAERLLGNKETDRHG